MAIVSRQWVPAASVRLQEQGPDYLAAVDDADWSEGIGFLRGFFSVFRIRAGRSVWFHFPLPTLVEQDGVPLFLDSVSLLWETLDGAQIDWIVAQHGGCERLPLTERLVAPPSVPEPFSPPEQWRQYYPAMARQHTDLELRPRLPLRFGVQLCVMVTAPAETDGIVRFYGAGAAFASAA